MENEKKRSANFIMILSWMFDNLKLTGNEALVFAIVYGFSQDGKTWYSGGSSYIARTTPFTQRTAKTHLSTLERLGVIELKKEVINGVERNLYRAVPGVEELVIPERESSKASDSSLGKNCTSEKISPVKKTSPNPGKIFPQTREKFSRKKDIKKDIKKSIYPREERGMDEMDRPVSDRESVLNQFREQLELDTLGKRYEPEKLDELLSNIADMYCCPSPIQSIGHYPQTTQAIRKCLDRLTSQHIEYVLDALQNTTKPIHNIRAYIRAALLNAPGTMEHYYQAKANSITAQARGGGF